MSYTSASIRYALSYAFALMWIRSLFKFLLHSSLSCIVLFFSSLFVLYINIMYYFLCTDLLCKFFLNFNKVSGYCHFCLLKIELLAVIRVIALLLTRH